MGAGFCSRVAARAAAGPTGCVGAVRFVGQIVESSLPFQLYPLLRVREKDEVCAGAQPCRPTRLMARQGAEATAR